MPHSGAALSAEGLRASVSGHAPAGPLLQRSVSRGCPALAALACRPALASHCPGSGVPKAAVWPLSRAGEGAGRRPGRGQRGPAPSADFRKFFLLPAGLLRTIRAQLAFPAAEVLFALMPPCFAASPAAGSPLASSLAKAIRSRQSSRTRPTPLSAPYWWQVVGFLMSAVPEEEEGGGAGLCGRPSPFSK